MATPFGVERMRAAGQNPSVEPFRSGEAGIAQQSLPYILECIREGRLDTLLMGWANEKLRAAGIDGRGPGDLDPVRRAQVLLDAHRAQTSYAPDPIGTERIQKPHVTYCLGSMCVPIGDCDDGTAALGAAMASIGINVYAVRQKFGYGAQEHVLLGIYDNAGRKWYVDPSTNEPVYQGSRARSEEWISPLDAGSQSAAGTSGAAFMTLGAPGVGFGAAADQCGIGAVGVGIPGVVGIVTPDDVLAYRQLWTPFVSATYRAALQCSQLWSGNDSSINKGQFAIPPDATTIQEWADVEAQNATQIQNEWNKYAGLSPADVVFRAKEILQSFQATVYKCGQDYRDRIATDCPSVVLPSAPDPSVQAQVIGRIEGLQILGEGILQILTIGASGAIESVGNAADYVKQTTQQALNVASSPWPWIALGLAGVTALGIVYAPEIKSALATRTRARKARAA